MKIKANGKHPPFSIGQKVASIYDGSKREIAWISKGSSSRADQLIAFTDTGYCDGTSSADLYIEVA